MKTKQNKQSKLVIAMSAVILVLVALSATLTFAYFTANVASSEESITFGNLKFGAGESITVTAADETFVPGDSITINGSATLKGDIDSYVRAKIDVEVSLDGEENGAATIEADIIKDIRAAMKSDCSLYRSTSAIDDTWVGHDGWLYYSSKVTASQISGDNSLSILAFDNNKEFTFEAGKYGNELQGATIKITIAVQAIQAEHLGVTITGNITDSNVTTLADAAAWATVANNGKVSSGS